MALYKNDLERIDSCQQTINDNIYIINSDCYVAFENIYKELNGWAEGTGIGEMTKHSFGILLDNIQKLNTSTMEVRTTIKELLDKQGYDNKGRW